TYVLYRIFLPATKQSLAVTLSLLSGVLVWLLFAVADYPTIVGLWIEIAVVAALGMWLLLSESIFASIAVVVLACAWLALSVVLMLRSEVLSGSWREGGVQAVMSVLNTSEGSIRTTDSASQAQA